MNQSKYQFPIWTNTGKFQIFKHLIVSNLDNICENRVRPTYVIFIVIPFHEHNTKTKHDGSQDRPN